MLTIIRVIKSMIIAKLMPVYTFYETRFFSWKKENRIMKIRTEMLFTISTLLLLLDSNGLKTRLKHKIRASK